MTLQLKWPQAPTDIKLAPDTVHILSASLAQPAINTAAYWDTLSPAERERADRFHFDRHRQRFIAARGIMRTLLGIYLGLAPHTLRLDYAKNGKPFLANHPLFFNISHAGDVGLFAFCLNTAVGIDIEKLKPIDDLNAIAARFFAAGEYDTLQSLPSEQQMAAFFRCWTRKEAFIKLIGDGLSYPLDIFEVSLSADEPARFLSIEGRASKAAGYYLTHLEPASNYIGALALSTKPQDLLCWQWIG